MIIWIGCPFADLAWAVLTKPEYPFGHMFGIN